MVPRIYSQNKVVRLSAILLFLFVSYTTSYGQVTFGSCPGTAVSVPLQPGGADLILNDINIPTLLGVDASVTGGGTVTYSASPSMLTCADILVSPVSVTITATNDDNGAQTAICNLNINVEDSGPFAVCQDITVDLVAGTIIVPAADIDSASTSCQAMTYLISTDGGATFNPTATFTCTELGANDVVLEVTSPTFAPVTCNAVITVNDAAPVANAMNITVSLDGSGDASIAAGDIDDTGTPSTTGGCGTGGLSIDVSSFDCDDIGTNTVVLTATNASGQTSTSSATVTVVDNMTPSAVSQNITVYLDASGMASIVAADVDGGSTDNCATNLSIDITDFDCTTVGANTVTLTVSDNATIPNTDMSTATVTVLDTVAPVLTCPADITVFSDPGSCDAVVTITNPTATDNCSTSTTFFSENFDAGVLPAGWTNAAAGTEPTALWMFGANGNNPGGQIDGSGMAFFHDDDFDGDGGDIAELTSPVIDLTTATAPKLSFDYIFEDNPGSFFLVEYTDDAGATWNTILNENTDPGCFGFDAGGCAPRTVTDFALPVANIQLRFTYDDGNAWAWYAAFDNVIITSPGVFTFNVTNDFNATTDASGTYPVGTTTVEFSTMDPSGNVGTCSIDVNVVPNPAAMNPGDQTVNNEPGNCQATVTWPSIAENCPGELTVTYDTTDPKTGTSDVVILTAGSGGGPVDFGDFPVGETTVRFTIEDNSGNTSLDSFVVTVLDNEAPSITCGGGQTIDFADCEAATMLVPDVRGLVSASDVNCSSFTITQDPPHTDLLSDHVTVANGNTFTIDVTVMDNNPNNLTDVCTITITLNEESDPTPLTATLPIINFDCGESLIVDAPVAVDACGTFICGEPLPSSAATLFGGFCSPIGGDTIVFGTDPTGLPSNSFDLTSVSSTLTVSGVKNQVLDVNVNLIEIEHTWVGDLTVTLTAPNGQVVTLLDRPGIGPTAFGCFGDDIVAGFDDQATSPYSDVNDNCTQPFFGNNTMNSPDVAGIFQPFQPLSIYNANYTNSTEMNGTWTLTVTDNVGGDVGQLIDWELEILSTGPADVPQYEIEEGNNTIFWIYIDDDGNTTQQIQEINVSPDTEAPTATCQNFTVQLDGDGEGTITAADLFVAGSEDDNCSDAADLTFGVSTSSFDCSSIGANNVTLTITDEAGNPFTCDVTVTVEDNVDPVITLMQVHMDTTINCDSDVVNDPAPNPTVEDNCGSFGLNLNQSSNKSGNPAFCDDYNYTITRTWTATDANGNSEDHVQIVTVQDTVAPTFDSDMTVAQSANLGTCEANVTYVASLSDNCAPNNVLDVTWTKTLSDGTMSTGTGLDASGIFLTGTNTILFEGSDPCDNTSTFTVTVTVTDDTAPIASCNSPLVLAIPVGASSITITPDLVDNGSLDNCNDVWLEVYRLAANGVTTSAPTFDCVEADGVTQYSIVLYVYEDFDPSNPGTDLGQLTTCETFITIQDNENPEAVCENITVYLDAAGDASIVPSDIDGGSFDDCSGLASIAFIGGTPTINYTTADIGANTETLLVTDVNGNIDICNAIVTVSPPVTCFEIPDLVSVNTGSNPVTITATNFNNAIGFQFALTIDTTVATFDTVNFVGPDPMNPYPLATTGTYTATVLPADGTPYDTINISWFSSTLVTEGTTPVFDLIIDVVGAVGDISPINFITAPGASLQPDVIVQYGLDFFSSSNGFPPCTIDGSIEVNEFAVVELEGNVRTWGYSFQDTLIDLTDPLNPDTTITTNTWEPVQNLANVILTKEETYPGFVGFPDPLSNTQINANAATTDVDGNYSMEIQNFAGGVELKVHARKEANWVNNGDVNGSDLFWIQQHIVGNIPFRSIYEYIAADANRDGKVNTLDLVLIQSVIVAPDVPGVTNPSIVTTLYRPWEFVPAKDSLHLLPLPSAPSAPIVDDTIRYANYTSADLNVDWIAVKIGHVAEEFDLDLDPTLLIDQSGPSTLTTNAVNPRGSNLNFLIENQEIRAGELVSIPVYAKDYQAFISWQFTIDFDENSLAYQGLNPGVLANFGEGKLGLNDADNGIIGAVWFGESQEIADDEILFTLEFIALKNASGLSGLLDLNSRTVFAQSVLRSGQRGNVNLDFFLPESTTTNADFTLFQNRPNPFKDKTMISFVLPKAGSATMTIFDVSGKVLKLVEGEFVKGYNEIDIQSSELPASGVLYYKLESAENTATMKMIIID